MLHGDGFMCAGIFSIVISLCFEIFWLLLSNETPPNNLPAQNQSIGWIDRPERSEMSGPYVQSFRVFDP